MVSITGYDGFYGAAQARQIAMGMAGTNNVVLREINALQVAVDTAATLGQIEVIVENDTTMTSSADYYNTWNDPHNNNTGADKLRVAMMNQIVNYFTRLGYRITRVRRGTDDAFNWKITW